MWEVIDTGKNSAKKNMEIDQEYLNQLDPNGSPILHFYDWETPSITHGYFIKPQDLLHSTAIQENSIAVARRPTGGGVVFHLWDLAFSVLIPANHEGFFENTLDNYRYINQTVLRATMRYLENHSKMSLLIDEQPSLSETCKHFCMAKPTQYDVMFQNRKIAGAAQRKKKNGYLHQGTISLAKPIISILESTLKDSKVVEAMQQNTFFVLDEGWTERDLDEVRGQFKELLAQSFIEKKS